MYSTRILGQNWDEGKKLATQPDPTRPDPTRRDTTQTSHVFTHPLLLRRLLSSFFLPTENLEQASADHTKGVF